MSLGLPRRILALIDIIIGIVILTSPDIAFFKFLIFFSLVKGIFSLIGSIATGFWLDFMGILDIVAALVLFGILHNWSLLFFPVVGVAVIIKGLISII